MAVNVTSNTFDLRNTYILSDYPIHFAGSALYVTNASPAPPNNAWTAPEAADHTVTLYVEESTDGTTWASVEFSTLTAIGQTEIDIVGGGVVVLLFTSNYEYVRFRTAAECEEGLDCTLIQLNPTKRENVSEYA